MLNQKSVNETQKANQTTNATAEKSSAPVQPAKSAEEIAEAKSRLSQLREHLDVTAMFLGQENLGKIIAKLEMDAANPPIP
jgi:uncharacterized FlaG/YvyC family protein